MIRNIKSFTGACLLVFGLCLMPSCSDNNEAVAPVFPENVQELSVATAGETVEFAFTANTDWTLTSSKLWCKFVSGEESLNMLYGTAGEQKVQVVATEDIWDFESATAEITLNMAGESKVIAKISRGAKGNIIDGIDENIPIEISYTTSIEPKSEITFNTNFDWELTKEGVPSWLSVEDIDLPVKGYAGRESKITFVVTPEAKVSAQEDKVTLKQLETGGEYSFPIKYAGMGDRDIEKSISDVWGWTVSQEGTQYWKGAITGDVDVDKKDFPLDINIAVKDNKYTVVSLVENNGFLVNPEDINRKFFDITDDKKGGLSIQKFDENTEKEERKGYILAFPNYVYNTELGGDIDNALLDEETSIKEEYEKYIVWNFKQEGNQDAASGFEVMKGGYEPIECLPGDGGTGLADMIPGFIGAYLHMDFYYIKVEASSYIQINPLLSLEEWNPGETNKNGIFAYDKDFTEDLLSGWEPTPVSETNFAMSGTVNKSMFISFSDFSQGLPMPCKALIIIVE